MSATRSKTYLSAENGRHFSIAFVAERVTPTPGNGAPSIWADTRENSRMLFHALSCPPLSSRRKRILFTLFALASLITVLTGCEKSAPPVVKNDAELKAETEKGMQRMMQDQGKAAPR